jgi:hypothetical protein
MRMSTSLLALGGQSGLEGTLETPTRARIRSSGSSSRRTSPLLTALHQGAKRILDAGVGRFEHLFVVSHEGTQRRGDDPFCCDGINSSLTGGARKCNKFTMK